MQAAVRETLAKTGAVPLMDFNDEGRVEIPVLRPDAVYREPQAMTNSAYNPFREEYIDSSAPMPDEAFTGFDVPYDGSMPPTLHEPAPRPAANRPREHGDEEIFVSLPSSFDMSQSDSQIEYIDEESHDGIEQELDYVSSSASDCPRTDAMPAARFEEVCSLRTGYATALYGGRLVVIDLRRVRERIVFENTLAVLSAGAAPSQRMLFPERLTLSREEYETIELHATEFAALGFEMEFLGDDTVEILGKPAVTAPDTPIDELIYDLLHRIDDGTEPGEAQRRHMAAVMAQRCSASFGRGIGSDEARQLLAQLESCDDRSFSPSGRPLMAQITTEEIKAKLS